MFLRWSAFALKHLKPCCPIRKSDLFVGSHLETWLRIWEPSLWNRAVKHSFLLFPETTSPHLGGSPTKEKLQPESVFFPSVNKKTYNLSCQCLDSKSDSYPPFIKHLDQSYLSVHMWRRISVFPACVNGAWCYDAVWWGTNVNAPQKQPQHCMRRRFNTEWFGNGKRERERKKASTDC